MENKVSLNNVLSSTFLKNEINNLYENGMPSGYTLNLKSIDNLFRLDTSMVAVVTGVPNYGKSEFLDFVCVRLNWLYGLKTLYFSPENFPIKLHLSKIIRKLTNKKFDDLTKEEIESNMNYICNNFYFLNYETVNTLDEILKEAEQLIVSNGIKILNIDPYNTLEDQRPNNLTETEYVSQVMTRLQKFSKKHNILINLVVHPKKLASDSNGYTVMPNRYDLNGSANFANKSDYIIIVHRNFDNDTTIIRCDKCKFSNYGQIGETEIKYDPISGNYFDIDTTLNADTQENDMYATALAILKENKEQKQTNVLDISVSFFEEKTEKKGTEINLYDYLIDKDKAYYNKYWAMVDCIRSVQSDEERKEIKRNSNLPCITVSCLTGEDKSEIKHINPLICIDIDKQDNETIIDRVPSLVKQLSCVAYFSKSVSGNGYYCLIPISNTDCFKFHFNALQEDFARMGITIDKSCSNPNRLRYYSYDRDAYININADIYTRMLEQTKKVKDTNVTYNTDTITENIEKVEMLESDKKQIMDMIKYLTINKIDITKDYGDWIKIGAGIVNAFGDRGYILFDNISRISNKYNSYECEEKYNNLLNNPLSEIGLGSVFHIYKKYREAFEQKDKAV